MAITLKDKNSSFPLFDTRDGKDDAYLQYKTYSEKHEIVYGTRGWNYNQAMERAVTGMTVTDDNYPTYLRRLCREARKRDEKILAATIHNYAVSIIVGA